MTNTRNYRVEGIVRWTARLWSIPIVAITFSLAAGPLIRLPPNLGNLVISLSSLSAMAFALAFVVAWHWERVGGWLALGFGVSLMVWFTIRLRHPALSPLDLLLWPPALLFLVSGYLQRAAVTTQPSGPDRDSASAPQKRRGRFFALPATSLGWWSLVIGAGFFVCMRLFWMQAGSPGRDRSTFFSDPINAACLIGAFGSAIVGMIVALVAIIWKRERSFFFVPLLLLGLFALLWAVAVMSGANA